MLALSLLWLIIGIISGALANAAKLQSATWQRWGWLITPTIGAMAALIGGWIGVLFVGQYFATGCALWMGILGVMIPGLIHLRNLVKDC